MNYKRIAIVGISGSGKSTVSRVIAEKTKLPLFHMDQLFWKGNWEAIPEHEYVANHQELIKKDEWIIEGYIDGPMADRLKRADLIIYLDYSGIRCFLYILRRWLLHRKESRPELHPEALERFSPRLLRVVITRKEREHIEEALEGIDQTDVVRLHTPRELKNLLNTYEG